MKRYTDVSAIRIAMHDVCKARYVPVLTAVFYSQVVDDFLSGYWKVRIQFQAWYCNKGTRKEGFCDLGFLEMKLWAGQSLLFRWTQCVSLFLSLMGYSDVIAHGLLKREYITKLHALVCMEMWEGKWEWKVSLFRDERKFCTLWKYTSLNERRRSLPSTCRSNRGSAAISEHSLSVVFSFSGLRTIKFVFFSFLEQGWTDTGRQVGIKDVRFYGDA